MAAAGSERHGIYDSFAFTFEPVFSVKAIATELAEPLRAHAIFINDRLNLLLDNETGKSKLIQSEIENLIRELEAKLIELASIDEANSLYLYAAFMKVYLLNRYYTPPGLLELDAFIATSETPSQPSLYWYRGQAYLSLVNIKKAYDNSIVAALAECIQFVPDPKHKKSLLGRLLHILERRLEMPFPPCSEYLDPAPLLKLAARRAELFDDPGFNRLNFEGMISLNRHEYLTAFLKSSPYQDFFNIHDTDEFWSKLNRNEARNIVITALPSPYTIKFTLPLNLRCNTYDLLKFICHLNNPSPFIPKFMFNNEVPVEVSNAFNAYLMKGLKELDFLNAEGFLIKYEVFIRGADKVITLNPDFSCLLRGLIREFKYGTATITFTEAHLKDFEENFVKTYLLIAEKRKLLGCFIEINALFLMRQAVLSIPTDPYPFSHITLSSAKLLEVTKLLDQCLHYAVFVKSQIKDLTIFDPSAHARIFSAAGKLIDSLWEKPRDLIFQVGTPIRDIKRGSEHAFYALLKFEVQERVEGFRIYLFNAGMGLEKHNEDARYDKAEFARGLYGIYHPVTSIFLAKHELNQKFLQNYIYRIWVLAYSIATDKKDFEEFTFVGYGDYTSPKIKFREPSPDNCNYRAQFSDTCTIYNLKRAILVATGMNAIEYGEFEDLLLIGVTQILAKAFPFMPELPGSKTSASSAGAGGITMLSGSDDSCFIEVEGAGDIAGLVGFDLHNDETEASKVEAKTSLPTMALTFGIGSGGAGILTEAAATLS